MVEVDQSRWFQLIATELVEKLIKKDRQLRKVQDRLGRARASNRRLKFELKALEMDAKGCRCGHNDPELPETD